MIVFSGDPGFYSRVLSLCRALSQYLLTVNQLPSSLRIPSDKELLITTFTCAATEVHLQLLRMSKLNHLSFFDCPYICCVPGDCVASTPEPVAPECGPAVGSVLSVFGPTTTLCLEQIIDPRVQHAHLLPHLLLTSHHFGR